MTNVRMILVAMLVVFIFSACGSPNTNGGLFSSFRTQQNSDNSAKQNSGSQAEQKLSAGIASYENEDFKSSVTELQSALDFGLRSKRDQVCAHKYLAFIYCVSNRKKQCRNEFIKALKVDPAFDLSPAEAGHPIWGPVFISEKAKFEKSISEHNER